MYQFLNTQIHDTIDNDLGMQILFYKNIILFDVKLESATLGDKRTDKVNTELPAF